VRVRSAARGRAAGTAPPPVPAPRYDARYATVVRDVITDALERHGSMRAAAHALGMPKSTLADKVKRLGLALPVRKADCD
jgi:DNA-binding NtrC family response regulator